LIFNLNQCIPVFLILIECTDSQMSHESRMSKHTSVSNKSDIEDRLQDQMNKQNAKMAAKQRRKLMRFLLCSCGLSSHSKLGIYYIVYSIITVDNIND